MPFTAEKKCRIVVVGGGITGLAAAHRLVELAGESIEQVDITLLDAADRFGGSFGTEQIGDYTIETGADSFITNKPWAIDLTKRLGMQDRLISPNPEFQRSLILHRGKTVVTPVGFNLLAPSQVWPMLKTPLLSPLGKARVAMEYFIPRKTDDRDESLANFVRRRFGRELLDKIVQPMVGGIYTSDPEKLSLKATLSRFIELERKHGSLIRGLRSSKSKKNLSQQASGARYGLFATPVEGMSELLQQLQKKIQHQVALRSDASVESIEGQGTCWTLRLKSGEQLEADGLVLALPTYRSAKLLTDVSPELSGALGQIQYASSAILVSGHREEDIDHDLNAFGLVIPHCEKRRILAVSFLSRKFPGRAPAGKVILRTFIGGAMQPEEIDHPDDEVIESALSELREILGVRGEPDFLRLVRYNRAMPQYTVGHLDRVAEIRKWGVLFPNLGLAGNGFDGVGIPDCVHSGEQAAESVWQAVMGLRESLD